MTRKPVYVGKTELPWESGHYRGPDVDPDARFDGEEGRWTLTGMMKEYKFFSPGVLPTTGIPTDFVAVFWQEHNLPPNEAPLWLNIGREIFKGLPAPLSHTLFACPEPYAAKLFAFLDRVSIRVSAFLVCDSIHQDLTVPDWPMLSRLSVMPATPPTVPVTIYGLAVGENSYLFKPAKGLDPITLVMRSNP